MDKLYGMDIEQRDQILAEEADKMQRPFSEYIIIDQAYEYALVFLDRRTCEGDYFVSLFPSYLDIGFKGLDYSKEHMMVESIENGIKR